MAEGDLEWGLLNPLFPVLLAASMRFPCACLLALFAFSVLADSPVQTEETFDGQVPVKLRYLLSLPRSYDADPNEQWPLMLFLHGAGERGDDLSRVKKHGPPKLIEAGKEFPMVVVSPQCPAGHRWQVTELMGLIDHIAAEHRIDPRRIYVTGLSMGGFGTWDLLAHAPERFAAGVPICGGGEDLFADSIARVPVRAYHGADDPVVPLHRSEEMVDAVRAAGGDVELIVYDGVRHDSWTQTYDDDRLYAWMLQQRLSTP